MEEMEEDLLSNSSSSDEEQDNKLEQRADELEQLVCSNVYLYDTHVELCGLYKKLGDLNSMREAYSRFSKVYPMTAKLWLDWIEVEVNLASAPDEKKRVLELFKTAVQDYHSVKLWQEYCQFAIGNCSLEETRTIFEAGLNAVGLHVSEGSLLWTTLREFELAHLSLATPDTEDFNSQLQKVTEVFRRQLSVPLIDMENTFKEWKDFIGQLPDDHGIDTSAVDWNYKKAIKNLEVYKPYEEKLMTSGNEAENYEIYREYISHIKDPCLIVCTYERAVSELCLNAVLWEDYCQYSIPLGELALTVSKKALRNCPWSVELWVLRLKILEVNDKPEKVVECFEEAVIAVAGQNPLELWLTYIEYLRRKDDKTEKLPKLFVQAKQQIDNTIDPTNKLLRLQIRLLSKNGDPVIPRKIWTEILQNSRNKLSGNIWIEYLNWEKQFGQPQNVRTLYQRAITTCIDWSQYFADEWLLYEREFGSVTQVLKCMEKCKKIVKVNDSSNKRAYREDTDNIESKIVKKQKTENLASTPYKRNERPVKEQPCVKVVLPPTDIDPPRTAFVSNIRANITENHLKDLFPKAKNVTIPTDRKGLSRCFAYVIFENEEDAAEALTRDREPLDGRPMFISKCVRDKTERHTVFKYENKLEMNKLFVKGLPRHFDQKAVENIFKPYGATEVRLVTKFNGQPKGLAYVDFGNAEDAEKALKNTDQMELGEFVITVAVSAPPGKNKGGGFAGQSRSVSTVTEHPKNRLQIPLVPRQLQVKKTDDPKPLAKSNEDFRNMINNVHIK